MKKYILLSIMLFVSGINIIAMEDPQKTCDVCFEDKSIYDFTKPLSCCGHNESCADCLIDVINTSLQEKTIANIKCPNRNCAQPINKQDIHALNPDLFKLFCDIAAYEYVNNEKHIKQCPTPDCRYQFINDYNVKQKFTCPSCEHVYCSNCLVQHAPEITCQKAKEWKLAENHDLANKATEEWIKSNTKQCPACHKLIQKNGGCNHMTCNQCRHQFCWTCGATYGSTACNSGVCERIMNQQPINQAQNNHHDIVQQLLANPNINVNQANHNGITPLMMAAQRGHAHVVQHLLAHPNINVNQVNHNGMTPLMIAAQNNRHEIVQLLLAHPNINVNNAINPEILQNALQPTNRAFNALLEQPRIHNQAVNHNAAGYQALHNALTNMNQANHNALNQTGQGNNARTTLQIILDEAQEDRRRRNFIQELIENGFVPNQRDIDLLNLEHNNQINNQIPEPVRPGLHQDLDYEDVD